MWVMLNPSTADAGTDDPTIKRCIQFSKDWGFQQMWVVNKYAYRSTDPKVLKTLSTAEAQGPNNDRWIEEVYKNVITVVAAWGNPGGTEVPAALKGVPLWCLGKTKSGAPKHPLYLPASTVLDKWHGADV